jgi:hypothetical protein
MVSKGVLAARKFRKIHPGKAKLIKIIYFRRLKEDVLTHYGRGKLACVKCGFSDIRALSIDHINGGGNKERKKLKIGGRPFYSYLKASNYPEGYQTLCMNCQWIKRVENNEIHKIPVEIPDSHLCLMCTHTDCVNRSVVVQPYGNSNVIKCDQFEYKGRTKIGKQIVEHYKGTVINGKLT